MGKTNDEARNVVGALADGCTVLQSRDFQERVAPPGKQSGSTRIREVLQIAGFGSFRKAIDTSFPLFLKNS